MEYLITDEEFDRFRSMVYRVMGISLNDGKKSLVVSRLSKRLRTLGLDTFHDYFEHIESEPAGDEFTQMLDCICTNKTDFFREPQHFQFLREHILPTLNDHRRVRIWSSACSSGEEPYTIAMAMYDSVATPLQWDWKVLASDLSTRVLAQAASGVYQEDRLRELSPEIVQRHFLKGQGAQAGTVKVKSYLSDMIRFQRINLMDEHYPIKTPLDVIFCRNVMIYFDRPTQQTLVNRFHRYLKPGGYLFIGHSESLQWVEHPFQSVAPTIYRKRA
ncbi:MAG: protein-glutamate O-methyltransferase CheR [Nitrospira sp.]|nr:protein-glutamate O-methyltransferase CheR [Nitrospira sp.]